MKKAERDVRSLSDAIVANERIIKQLRSWLHEEKTEKAIPEKEEKKIEDLKSSVETIDSIIRDLEIRLVDSANESFRIQSRSLEYSNEVSSLTVDLTQVNQDATKVLLLSELTAILDEKRPAFLLSRPKSRRWMPICQ